MASAAAALARFTARRELPSLRVGGKGDPMQLHAAAAAYQTPCASGAATCRLFPPACPRPTPIPPPSPTPTPTVGSVDAFELLRCIIAALILIRVPVKCHKRTVSQGQPLRQAALRAYRCSVMQRESRQSAIQAHGSATHSPLERQALESGPDLRLILRFLRRSEGEKEWQGAA